MNQSFHTEEIISEPQTEFQMMTDLRQRVLAGEEIPAEEYAKVIESLRRSRTAQPIGKVPKGKGNVITTSKLQPSTRTAALDDLLGDL